MTRVGPARCALARLALAAMALLTWGCGSHRGAEGPRDAQVVDASPDVADPNCHVDCFSGSLTCAGGVVTATGGGAIPCDRWPGTCGERVAYTCTAGCSVEGAVLWNNGFDPEVLCAETPSVTAGSPCGYYDSCLPSPAIIDDGGVRNQYFECVVDDVTTTRTCQPTRGPTPTADYMQPCPQLPAGVLVDGGGVGVWAGCPSGLCLGWPDWDAGCFRSGCTQSCMGDQECPMGSVCDDSLPNLLADYGLGAVCKPGPKGVAAPGLGCQ